MTDTLVMINILDQGKQLVADKGIVIGPWKAFQKRHDQKVQSFWYFRLAQDKILTLRFWIKVQKFKFLTKKKPFQHNLAHFWGLVVFDQFYFCIVWLILAYDKSVWSSQNFILSEILLNWPRKIRSSNHNPKRRIEWVGIRFLRILNDVSHRPPGPPGRATADRDYNWISYLFITVMILTW